MMVKNEQLKYESEKITIAEKYQDYYDKAPFAYQVLDETGAILDVNPQWCKETGYSREEVIGKPFTDFLTDSSKQIFINAFKALKQNGTTGDVRLELLTRTNETIIARYEGCTTTAIDGHFLHSNCILQNITKQVEAEKEVQRSNRRMEILLELYNFTASGVSEILNFALEKALELSESKIGYIYFYNEEAETFTLHAWSKNVMQACSVLNPETTYLLKNTGAWGEAVRQSKPFIINDYSGNNPHKKGIPHGHVELKNFLTVPVFSNNQIVATIGVANKPSNFNDTDIRQLQLLMNSVWDIVESFEYKGL